jgi:uncharacterized membrane protein AbrB (regulator of aidB expression)
MMAVIVEAIVEYGKTIGKAFTSGDVKTAVTQLCAILISTVLCFTAGANLFAVLGIKFGIPWVGTLLTGIFASRGANFVSDLVKKIQVGETK